jgi:hypothetical protein
MAQNAAVGGFFEEGHDHTQNIGAGYIPTAGRQ